MPFVKGQKKVGGRAKGTPNQPTRTLIEKAKEIGADPFEILLRFAAEDWQGLGYPARSETKFSPAGIEFEEYVISPQMRVKAASEACQYIHAKRKAIESTVDPALIETIKSLEGKTEEELLAILNNKPQ